MSEAQAALPAPGTYRRKHSGTASWHMSRKAVSLSVPAVLAWSDEECMDFMVTARFGGWDTVRCPHCGSISRHYWRSRDRRWQCQACRSTFSVTSGTTLADRKLPLQKLVAAYLLFMNSAAGQPALELKRHLDISYNVAYMLQQKMREGFVRGYNVGLMSGDIEMDGSHHSGKRSAEKRGKPQVSQPLTEKTPIEDVNDVMVGTASTRGKRKKAGEGERDFDYGTRLPKGRRFLIVVARRSGVKGRGANGTRVAIAKTESDKVAEAVTTSFVAVPESYLNTDEADAYEKLGKRFMAHRTVTHSRELRGPKGENNNLAEELNRRMDRAEQGVYLNIEAKYMLDYAAEAAFRSDTRRLPNGEQLRLALAILLNVGPSLFWRGFTRGHHRSVELLHLGPEPAPPSGPAKGRNPFANATGRPPR